MGEINSFEFQTAGGSVNSYLLDLLQKEISELQSELGAPARLRNVLAYKKQELYWTLDRLLGLSKLRDGFRHSIADLKYLLRASRAGDCGGAASSSALRGGQRRILIDCTAIHLTPAKTGVQRVARNLVKHFPDFEHHRAVVLTREGIFEPAGSSDHFRSPLALRDGDVLVIPQIGDLQSIKKAIEKIHERNGKAALVIHDLIPMLYPGACDRAYIEHVKQWYRAVLPSIDLVLAISKTVASDLRAHLPLISSELKEDLKIGWFHHGAGLDEIEGEATDEIVQIANAQPFFLTVGAVEPRKAHLVAIEAFEKLWAKGSQARYVIAGKPGWLFRATARRILEHPEYGKRLFWIQNAGDADLKYLYEKAAALIFPSIAEGFGLPLIEAAHFHTPLIVSDIPIFKEICGSYAEYFRLLDPDDLSDRIAKGLDGALPRPDFHILSWSEASEIVFKLAREDAELNERWISMGEADESLPLAPALNGPFLMPSH